MTINEALILINRFEEAIRQHTFAPVHLHNKALEQTNRIRRELIRALSNGDVHEG